MSWTPDLHPTGVWDVSATGNDTTRITEDGRIRLTEDGRIRIIERRSIDWTITTSPTAPWTPS
jgi:hypothetical protein